MSKKYWKALMIYYATMSIFMKLYNEGVLSEESFIKLEESTTKNSGLNPLSIYRITIDDLKNKRNR